ncbi:MAG: restriction endonuclease subunit S [Nannocystaceae bacterium]
MIRLTRGIDHIPDSIVPTNWEVTRIGDVSVQVAGGRLGLTKGEDYSMSGVAAYSAAGQDGFVRSAEFVDTEGVVLSAIGAQCGKCFYATGEWTTLANTQALIPTNRLSARYLWHRVNRDDYWPRTGSAQPFIKPSSIRGCRLLLPPLPEQRRIAEILDTVDEAIRKTEEVIAKLQQMKQGLLHDLLTRGIDDNGELRDPDRHPEQFKDSELGRIPRAWEVRHLATCVRDSAPITYGIVQAGPNVPGGVPYIRTGDMSGDSLTKDEMLCTSPRLAAMFSRSRVEEGEIVCAIRASVGKVLKVPAELDGANLTQGTARISPHPSIESGFLFWSLRGQQLQKQFDLSVKGTTFREITLARLRQLLVPIPGSRSEQESIASLVGNAQQREVLEHDTLDKLRRLKSALMNDLLTGRVRTIPTEPAAP